MVASAIIPFFNKFPFLQKLLIEILRCSIGIYLSTTRDQVIFNLMSSALNLGLDVMPEIRELISGLFFVEQSGDSFGSLLNSALSGWNKMKDNSVLNDLKKGLILIIRLGFTSVSSIAQYVPALSDLLNEKFIASISGFDIISYSLELIVSIYDRMKAVIETRSLSSFFCPAPNLISVSQRYDEIVAKYPHALAGNLPAMYNEDTHIFYGEINNVHKRLEKIALNCSIADRVFVNRWKNDLAKKLADLAYFNSSRPIRCAPYSVNLIGGSGVGKTGLIATFAVALARSYDVTLTKDDICYNDPNDKYFSNYHGQICLIEDDKNANIAVPGGVNENDVTLRVVNNATMPLVKAGVEEKGIYSMNALFHIMSTNVPNAQAHILSNEPAAVLRRSHHFVVEVKPEFCLPDSTMLDPSKCKGKPLEDNAWLITILEVKVQTINQGSRGSWMWKTVTHNNVLMNRVELHDALIYISDTCKVHRMQQDNIVRGFDDLLANSNLCEHGSGLQICRICNFIPSPAPVVTYVDMGHTHIHGVGRVYPTQSSAIVISLLSGFYYGLLPITLYWLAMVDELSFTSLIFRNLSRRGYLDNIMIRYTNRIVRVGDSYLWNSSKLLYFFLWSSIYSFTGCVSFLFYGQCFITYWLLATGITNFGARISRHFYRALDIRGARNTLRDIVAVRARPILESKLFYTGVTAAIVGALTCYRLMNTKKYVDQGTAFSANETPIGNGWSKLYVPPKDIPLSRRTTTSKDLAISMGNRIAFVKIYRDGDTKIVPGNMLPIKSGAWLCPSHYFFNPDSGEPLDHTHMDLLLNDSLLGASLRRIPIDRKLIRRFASDEEGSVFDLCVVFIPQTVGQMRDITVFFSDGDHRGSVDYVYREMDGSKREGDVKSCLKRDILYNKNFKGIECDCPFKTFIGLCGAIQVSNTKNPYIVSMHVAGQTDTTKAVCAPIYKNLLMEALDSLFEDPFTLQTASMENMDLSDGDSTKVFSDEIHVKSPLNHLSGGSVLYYGRVGERAKPVASVINTMMSETVEKVFSTPNVFGNPRCLRSWKPWYKAMANIVVPTYKDPILLRLGVTLHQENILECLVENDLLHAKPLDELTVLSGLDGDDMFKHIDCNTSSGWPFRKKKSEFVEITYHPEDKKHQWHFVMNDWARSRVESMRNRCDNGLRPNCIFSANLKVEVKSIFEEFEGVLVEKEAYPRVFYAASFEFVFLMRQYFLPILKIIQLAEESEISVGINVMGPDWGNLADRLLSVSSDILEADQEKFDQSVTPEELIPWYRFAIEIARRCGYCKKDLRIMSNLVGCVITPIIDFDGDMVTLYSIAISGAVGTVQWNSLVNGSRFRSFFFKMIRDDAEFARKISSFDSPRLAYKSLIKGGYFGDDSVNSVNKSINQYNMISFAEFMSSWGVNVTSAAKGVITKELFDITEVDYLKRSFLFDVEENRWKAPLKESSIFKRLMAMIPSSVLTHEEQCAEAISSSIRDYYEYGREVFNDRREKLSVIAETHNLMSYLGNGLPTYDYFVLEYKLKNDTGPIPQLCGM